MVNRKNDRPRPIVLNTSTEAMTVAVKFAAVGKGQERNQKGVVPRREKLLNAANRKSATFK